MASQATTTAQAPELLRQLGVISASALVVSNMIGTGVFGTTGFLAGDLGSPSVVLWIWVVGAICALMGAFCYSELGVNFPSSGAEYHEAGASGAKEALSSVRLVPEKTRKAG